MAPTIVDIIGAGDISDDAYIVANMKGQTSTDAQRTAGELSPTQKVIWHLLGFGWLETPSGATTF